MSGKNNAEIISSERKYSHVSTKFFFCINIKGITTSQLQLFLAFLQTSDGRSGWTTDVRYVSRHSEATSEILIEMFYIYVSMMSLNSNHVDSNEHARIYFEQNLCSFMTFAKNTSTYLPMRTPNAGIAMYILKLMTKNNIKHRVN